MKKVLPALVHCLARALSVMQAEGAFDEDGERQGGGAASLCMIQEEAEHNTCMPCHHSKSRRGRTKAMLFTITAKEMCLPP